MERLERRDIIKLITMIMVMVTMMEGTECALHTVGGKQGWAPNSNYTEWAGHEHFYVGDWLKFVFNRYLYNVLEVNKTSYETCNDQGFIRNLSRGAGRDVVQLTEARPYYFLSSGGYCWGGMKLAVNVEEIPVTAPAPAPAPATDENNGSASKTGKQMIAYIAFYAALAWSIFLKI